MEGNRGDGRGGWGGGRGPAFGRVRHRYGPDLGNARGSYLRVADEVAGWLAAGRAESAFDDGRLAQQWMIWMYNPHNLRMFYRYRGFI
jgi:hypothetical protein